MLKSVLLAFALSIAVFLLTAGCATSPAGTRDSPRPEYPRAGGADEAFLPVPREMYERNFPQGGLYRIPEDPHAAPLLKRAAVYEEKKEWQSAVGAYALAYERAGKGTAAPYILFKRCVLDDDLDRSIAGLKELLQGFSAFPLVDAVRMELAGRLALRGQYESGLSVLNGLDRGPFAAYAASLSGELYFKLGRYEQSLGSYERARGELAGSALPSGELFLVRCYLGISRTLIARGDDAGREGARELLRRIAGTPSHPYLQAEALALLRNVTRAGEEPASVLTSDEGLLNGSYRLGPNGNLHVAEGTLDNPGYGASTENGSGNYAVQVGSFGIRDNAENFAIEITGKGFSGFLSEATVGGRSLFRVRVGPFTDLSEAEEAKRRLGALGYSGFVVRER
jgi:tetratricopeptide (TPR) repeat protein